MRLQPDALDVPFSLDVGKEGADTECNEELLLVELVDGERAIVTLCQLRAARYEERAVVVESKDDVYRGPVGEGDVHEDRAHPTGGRIVLARLLVRERDDLRVPIEALEEFLHQKVATGWSGVKRTNLLRLVVLAGRS